MGTAVQSHNGLTIRYMRIKDGQKRTEFAESLRISYQHLDNLENERKGASPELIHRIATALNVPVGAILRDPDHLSRLVDTKPTDDEAVVA